EHSARFAADPLVLLQLLVPIVHTFFHSGDVAKAIALTEEAVGVALSLGLRSRACIAAARLTSMLIDLDDSELAQRWSVRAVSYAPESLPPLEKCVLAIQATELAVCAGDYAKARAELDRARAFPMQTMHRVRAAFVTLDFLIDFGISPSMITDDRCRDIISLYEHSKHMEGLDILVTAAYHAVSILIDERAAGELVIRFVTETRNRRAPLSRHIRTLYAKAASSATDIARATG
ncbi:MAG: hypothetical protein M3Z30_01850, partial [Gemmatimonadota bacterium]|nr:hypothetical protein [Gemmatimonadota bacterium]